MDRENESVYLLDMTACEPAHAISRKFEPGKWTAADYRIEPGDGSMLFSSPGSNAPPIRLNPEATGWFHIYVGTHAWLTDQHCLLLKLSGDAGYTRMARPTFRPGKDLVPPEMVASDTDLTETFWKSADLTGQDIIFHRPSVAMMGESIANISYIRLVPMSDAERNLYQSLRPRDDTRRLIANYDGGQHFMWGYATQQEMVDEFLSLAESDFKILLWGCARALAALYPSRVVSEEEWTPGLINTRHALEGRDRRRRHGFDPLRSAVQAAHGIGMEIYPQVRMTGVRPPPSHLGYGGPGDFHFRHPEWLCRTVEGYDTLHLSHAFPEVRAKYVELFREWVDDYEADGVCIIFVRSFPYVFYEEPIILSFKEKYGLDMKALDRFDKRVLAHRAHYLTETLRETRRMLDEVGEKQGRRLGTCFVVPGDDSYKARGCPDLGPFTTPRSLGMDIETWVQEGLVDHLVVHLEGVGAPDASDRPPFIRPYVDLAKGTEAKVYADLYPRRQSPDSLRVRAMACYDAGVDGLGFWDCNARPMRLAEWAMHRVLGHKEDLPELKRFAEGLFRVVPLITLEGIMVQHEDCQSTDG